MIYCNLSGLIAEKHINISVLSKETGISRTTLTSIYYNHFKGIQIDTLNSLCKYFDVSADKLLVFSKYDISVELAEYDFINLEDLPSHTDNTIRFDVSLGKITRKSDVCCGLYFTWHSDYVYIEPELSYYEPEANPHETAELARSNAFLRKVFLSLPIEIKNYIRDMVQHLITSYINSELDNCCREIEIGEVSFNGLI